MPIQEVVKIIKERREELGVTQEQLAEIAEIALRTLKNIESGKGNPTLITLLKVIEVLGLAIRIDVKS